MIWVIARRELFAMFLSPLAWVILAVIQILLGYMFLTNLDNFFLLQPQLMQLANTPGVTDVVITPLMQVAAIILLMIMPLLTMRSIAEEKRNRTLSLLISSPLSMSEIVLGKYLGLLLFVVILVSMLMLMPLSLYLGTSPDGGKLLSIYLGMLLLLGTFAAIGLYLSSLPENQTI
ncbi:MAG: ABC transporter permease subunit, partial [Gammaproteobacteria bacterium]|nr:ABC transporter permease subunit [Gammaproteobacteria bacterium]